MPDLPIVVSTVDFASLVGLTPRRIQQLISTGNLRNSGHGKIDLREGIRAFIAWRVENEMHTLRAELERRKETSELDAERTRKLRLENDEKEQTLIRTEDAIAAVDAIVGQIPGDLSAVAARVTDDISIRRRIEDEIDRALNGLAERFAAAGAALASGGDAFASGAEDEPDDVGARE